MTLQKQPEEASTHKCAKTHAGNVFVTPDLLTPQDSSWNICMSRLVILAASVFAGPLVEV